MGGVSVKGSPHVVPAITAEPEIQYFMIETTKLPIPINTAE
jgi:hypothetical protein